MDTFDSLLQALKGMSPTQLRALADASGVSEYTLSKIKSGETPNPRVRTFEKLKSALAEQATNGAVRRHELRPDVFDAPTGPRPEEVAQA